ncbi:MAG: hypothetical protein JWL76_2352 [Thermoleophilia bacterium]|nr:hypothetical protein [Thermoleophilia bacterium]
MRLGDAQLQVVDEALRHVRTTHRAFGNAAEMSDPFLFGATRGGFSRARELAAATGAAAEAERLLAPIAGDEPGLAPLLDAVRGARAMQEMRLPEREAAFWVYAALDREQWAVKAWKHVLPLDQDARVAELARIRTTGSVNLTKDDWRTLAGIVGDDPDATITAGLPRSIGDAMSLRNFSLRAAETSMYDNRTSGYFVGHQYFDAWQAAQLPVDVRRARIDELFSGDPAARTKEEWHELTSLLRAGGHDLVEHPWFPGQQLDDATRSAQVVGYERARDAAPILERANAAEQARVRDQLLRPGDLDPLAQSVLRRGQLHRLDITGSEASAVRLRHMLPTDPSNARDWMHDVRAALETATPTGPVTQLRETAYQLLDRNLARVDGERWWRPYDGYANHPDYAELGRVRSIYQLLEQVGAIPVHPSMQPAPPAPVAAAAAGAEQLSW